VITHNTLYTQAKHSPAIAKVMNMLAEGSAYAPTLLFPSAAGRFTYHPPPWHRTCAKSEEDPHHRSIIVDTTIAPPQHELNDETGYCDICRNHQHPTNQCHYINTVMDPSDNNLARIGITRADTIIASFCKRLGMLYDDEIAKITNTEEWTQLAQLLCDRQPKHSLPGIEPIDHDSQPIFGPTTVEALRTKINQHLLDTDHQYRAARLTLRYGAFIAHPMPDQGANPVPLPMFDWHDPTNQGALRISMNDVICSDTPVCFIPPASTIALTAALCQRLVTGGARFKTQIQVKITETTPRHYTVHYVLAFAQHPDHKLTTTIQGEEQFLDPSGRCCIPILTLQTQCTQVLAAATSGDISTTGCEAITSYILENCQNTHHSFTKWTLQSGTAHFYLIPDEDLTHTLRLLAVLFEQILPMNHINIANQSNPLSTHYQNHTERPSLRVVTHPTFWNNMGNHQRLWSITAHLIQAFQTHPHWKEHHSHATGSRATDTSASSSLAPVTPTSAPLQHTVPSTAGTGPTTAKGPPTVAVPAASFKKATPPSPPVYSFAG
jgi:hypothetical protein